MEALASGPLGRAAIAAAMRPKVSRRVRYFMENSWSHVRVPVADGLTSYGGGEGKQVVFIRVDQWLPKLKGKNISPTQAQCELLRKYLRSYRPGTLHDFSHWAGIPMQEVTPLRPLLASELEEIPAGKKNCLLPREDMVALNNCSATGPCIRLLPTSDPSLLPHPAKHHLLHL